MRVSITKAAKSGEVVSLNIYPVAGTQVSFHDCIITKSSNDKKITVHRYFLQEAEIFLLLHSLCYQPNNEGSEHTKKIAKDFWEQING